MAVVEFDNKQIALVALPLWQTNCEASIRLIYAVVKAYIKMFTEDKKLKSK
jgi:hypothetical protein